MAVWTIQLTSLSQLKRKVEKLKHNTRLKTITRKYYRGSDVWVLVYEG